MVRRGWDPAVRTVLGLAKTSTSIGWVLVDGRDVAGDPLDHDAFDVVADASVIEPAATVRRALAIATATGYTVDCVRLTSSDPVHTNAASLRKALRESGFRPRCVGSADGGHPGVGQGHRTCQRPDKKTAVCILDRDSATLSVIDTRSGAIKATTTKSRDSAQPHRLAQHRLRPERFAARAPVPDRLSLRSSTRSPVRSTTALSIPVVATHDAHWPRPRCGVFRPEARRRHRHRSPVRVRIACEDAHRDGRSRGRLPAHAVLRRQSNSSGGEGFPAGAADSQPR